MRAAAEPAGRRWPGASLLAPGRVLLAIGLWAAAGLVIVQASATRFAEARLGARLAGLYLPGHAEAAGDVFFAGLGTRSQVGLQITPECTVVILVVPMLVVAGIITLFGQFSLRGVLAGVAAGLAADLVANQVRIGLIAWAASRYGSAGYEVTHKLIGSLIAMLGFTAAFVLMICIMARRPAARRLRLTDQPAAVPGTRPAPSPSLPEHA